MSFHNLNYLTCPFKIGTKVKLIPTEFKMMRFFFSINKGIIIGFNSKGTYVEVLFDGHTYGNYFVLEELEIDI